ncbi:TAXI family TRAP transporter solute-binding subunit [Moorella sulfitireducens]|uniref:TAXI family TRAP transporter solute-binding subunit n=1 Tax=Neomoorella sulfitireducens TaxID=2972948 RepID=UPI0021AC7120|nr:TAXI family TRAP transporter solute-binding subunit [Moorella sulfitireducens]
MKKKSLAIFLGFTLLLNLIIVGCGNQKNQGNNPGSSPQQGTKPKFLVVGTASSGGAYYPIGIGLADIITNTLGIQTTAQVTGGAVENNELIKKKDVDLAITMSVLASRAYKGEEPYKGKNEEIRTLFTGLSKGIFHVVVNDKSDIRSIKDLKGKKVVLGPAGGGGIYVTLDVLSAYGISLSEIQPLYIPYDEGTSALTDGNVDAVVVQSAAPASAITQLTAAKKPVRILSIEDDILKIIFQKYPYYKKIDLPKEIYNTDQPITTIYDDTTVVINKDLDEQMVYNITKAIFENLDKVKQSHPSAKNLQLENAAKGVPVPLHPGAEKYYKEKGVL